MIARWSARKHRRAAFHCCPLATGWECVPISCPSERTILVAYGRSREIVDQINGSRPRLLVVSTTKSLGGEVAVPVFVRGGKTGGCDLGARRGRLPRDAVEWTWSR